MWFGGRPLANIWLAMRARVIALAVTAVLLAASGCADESTSPQSSATNPPASSEVGKTIERCPRAAARRRHQPGHDGGGRPRSDIGIWGPDGNYVRAFGVADKTTRAPMKTDFYSRIGSVTKTFTVTAVLQLADQGKLGLDDPIAEYVDGVPLGDRITLRQLARMQSGLFNYSASRRSSRRCSPIHAERSLRTIAGLRVRAAESHSRPAKDSSTATPTRSCWVWWCEKVSGQPLPAYIRDQILDRWT